MATQAPTEPLKPLIRQSFDPFAPLPSSQPSTFSTFAPSPVSTPNYDYSQSRAPSSESQPRPSNSSSGSGSRAPRPSSLYIPMDDEKRTGTQSGNTPTWPFDANGTGSEHLRPSLSSNNSTPLSPSEIHPSYSEQASYYPASTSTSPQPITEPQNLYSSISISSSPASEAAFSSSAYPGFSRNGSLHSSKGSVLGNRPLTGGGGGGGGTARHSPAYSVGTHALLSSRQNGGSPIAGTLMQRLDTPAAWLVLYFAFNLGLTLFNKLVLQGFPFPWTLTAIQMLSGTIGTQIALSKGLFTQARLTTKENGVMLAFSGLYTINIAVSNLSLHLVSVPFHQVVRAMTPLFTMALSIVLYRKRYSRQTYLSLVPVIMGVAFATFGDYSATAWGFFLTLIGAVLAAFKTIITNRVQVGRLKLHPLDLLVRMSPLAFMQCVFFGWWSGELERVRIYGATEMTQQKGIALAINGAIAFGLNVVSFTANKKTSALTMTVAANVKQVLSIVLAVLIFNLVLNPTNLLGIVLTLFGGAWYAKVELQEKQARAQLATSTTPNLAPVGGGAKLG
ncbi:uncharacterized protein JCM6883_000710 [Sporobolomyces salmoneus]|uniref:uncharacterized protein n=1 Tax=Sporobolomyces salmoneus TaxID=183962 RepID=UPI0031758E7F